jgi:hypothetical protein
VPELELEGIHQVARVDCVGDHELALPSDTRAITVVELGKKDDRSAVTVVAVGGNGTVFITSDCELLLTDEPVKDAWNVLVSELRDLAGQSVSLPKSLVARTLARLKKKET